MTDVMLFHSVYGCRPAEQEIAARLRRLGHRVVVPDLYDGRTAETVDEGFAIYGKIGADHIAERAAAAAADMPPAAVLAGVSMGASVAAGLWALRPQAAGILLLHGVCALPDALRPGIPLQLHLAEPDAYEDETFVADWLADAAGRGIAVEAFRYPGAGHYFLDASLGDHDAAAAAHAWERIEPFVARLGSGG
jgi:dienelactone hydrolase